MRVGTIPNVSKHVEGINVEREFHACRRSLGRQHGAKQLMQRAGTRRLQLEVKPIIPFEAEDRRFGGAEQAHGRLFAGLAGQLSQGVLEGGGHFIGEFLGRFLFQAPHDEPG